MSDCAAGGAGGDKTIFQKSEPSFANDRETRPGQSFVQSDYKLCGAQ